MPPLDHPPLVPSAAATPALSSRRPAWGWTVGIGVFAAYLLAYLLWQLCRWGGPDRQALIGDLALIPPNGVAALVAWRAAARPGAAGRSRRSWRLIALAYAVYGLADTAWAVYELILHQSPFPSGADVGYLAWYPLMFAAFLFLPVQRRDPARQRTFWLDLATVLVGGTMVVWFLLLRPIVLTNQDSIGDVVLALVYPVLDVALLFGMLAVLLRGPVGVPRSVLWLLVGSVGCEALADLLFSVFALKDSFQSGSWVDLPWLLAKGGVALAAWWQLTRAGDHPTATAEATPDTSWRWQRLLPYLAVAGGYALLLGVARPLWTSTLGGLLVGSAVLTALAIGRQVVVLRENARLVHQLTVQALRDGLTGLYNRRLLLDRLSQALAVAARQGAPVVVLYLDLDGFKAVNDGYGHAAGDQVLVAVAHRLQACLREADTLARLGGDEFVVLFGSPAALELAVAVAIRLLVVLRLPIAIAGGHEVRLGGSIGLASSAAAGATAEALLARADAALYQAKQAGKGTYVVADAHAPLRAVS